MLWRRSYDVPPPQIEDNDDFSQANDIRYKVNQFLNLNV